MAGRSVTFTHLLAKSTADPEHPAAGTMLLQHTVATVRAAEAILGASERSILLAMGLDGGVWSERLQRATLLAAFAHDLGKANDHFQGMVQRTSKGRVPQALRHELLSLWLAGAGGPLGAWLFAGTDDLVQMAVLSAIAGHHLKFESGAMPFPTDAPRRLALLGTHPDFARTLVAGQERLGLLAIPMIGTSTFDSDDETLEDACRPTLLRLQRAYRASGAEERRFVGAVKALAIAADLVASVSVRRPLGDGDTAAWVAKALMAGCTQDEMQRIAEHRLGGGTPRAFQAATGASEMPVTLVRAGCGSGKTVAAYLWASRWAVGRKLFVCYPTTGTATEGYADYVLGEDVDGLLAHSRAEVDLEYLLETGDESAREMAQQWAALERALRLWPATVVVCTTDTVLGLLQNYRGGLFAFPAIAGGAFVFDEIHQYDDRLFSALLRFLDEFPGAPVLLMTASLQPHRREALENAAARRGQALPAIGGPEDLETGLRYVLRTGTLEDAYEGARAALGRGEKVLWVCNTVDAAIAAADLFEAVGQQPLVYHSRFPYEDRVTQHRAVVDAFKRPGPVLAVTTQVCEVSLDLSADLLVSQVAPAPAMIQRLGRLNRRFDPERPATRPAIFVEPESHLPYEAGDVELGREWLRHLANRAVSQRDLATAFEGLAALPRDQTRVDHAWLDKVPFAVPASLREPENTIPIVLPADAARCRDARGLPRLSAVVRRSLPMPLFAVKDELGRWERIGMAFVPPVGRVVYSRTRGARWLRTGG